MYNDFYLVKNNVLFKHIVDNGHGFEARVIPHSLVDIVLHLGHNQSGHNGYQRTYAAIKCLYYWKGMRMQILIYCKHCKVCAQQKVQKTQFEKQIFEPGVQPMEFISMDLVGEFHPPSSKGNRICTNCCLYVDRIHFLHPNQEQISRGNCDSLEKSYCFPVWCLQEITHRQWNRILK